MGLFTKKAEPPTATDYVENPSDDPATASDPEKAVAVGDEDPAQPTAHHVHPEIERRVLSKMDRRIPVLVAAGYLLAFLDRSNIGNARIAGMTKDLNLKGMSLGTTPRLVLRRI